MTHYPTIHDHITAAQNAVYNMTLNGIWQLTPTPQPDDSDRVILTCLNRLQQRITELEHTIIQQTNNPKDDRT